MEANNMKAMQDALKVIRGMVNEELEDLKDISDEVRADFISIRGWCDHALAKPPRNCEVGTVEEQSARWWKFCDRHFIYSPVAKDNCAKCPIRGTNRHCELAWAQMQYEAEKGDAKWSKK